MDAKSAESWKAGLKAFRMSEYAKLTDEQKEELRIQAEAERIEEEEKDRLAEIERVAALRQKRLAEFIDTIPLRFRDCTFENFVVETDAQRDAIKMLNSGESGIFYGTNGVGKTHLAWAHLRNCVAQGKRVGFVKVFRLFGEIKASFADHSTNQVLDRYINLDVLVIDEVEKSYWSQSEFINLYEIISERIDWMRQTIVIGNLKTNTLEEVLGTSLVSRLCGIGQPVDLSGPDWRMR